MHGWSEHMTGYDRIGITEHDMQDRTGYSGQIGPGMTGHERVG